MGRETMRRQKSNICKTDYAISVPDGLVKRQRQYFASDRARHVDYRRTFLRYKCTTEAIKPDFCRHVYRPPACFIRLPLDNLTLRLRSVESVRQ